MGPKHVGARDRVWSCDDLGAEGSRDMSRDLLRFLVTWGFPGSRAIFMWGFPGSRGGLEAWATWA